jgi:hypothetical protein
MVLLMGIIVELLQVDDIVLIHSVIGILVLTLHMQVMVLMAPMDLMGLMDLIVLVDGVKYNPVISLSLLLLKEIFIGFYIM